MSNATDTAEAILKHVFYELILQKLIGLAIVKVTWLGGTLINPVFVAAATWLANKIYPHIKNYLVFNILDFEVYQLQLKPYVEQINLLRAELTRGEPADVIERRREEVRNRMRELIRMRDPL